MAGRNLDGRKVIRDEELENDINAWTEIVVNKIGEENWEKAEHYCNRVLQVDPENVKICLYKIMVKRHCKTKEELKDQKVPFDDNSLYATIIEFASTELRSELDDYNAQIKARAAEKKRLEDAYSRAVEHQEEGTIEMLEKAASEFYELGIYSDSIRRAEECLKLARQLKKGNSDSFMDRIKNIFKKTPFSITRDGTLSLDKKFDKALLTDLVLPLMVRGIEVKHIADGAFAGCRNLTSVSISADKVTIGKDAFKDCPIKIATVNSNHVSGIPKGKLRTAIITGKNGIRENAFAGCTTLELVKVATGGEKTTISEGGFDGCTNLKTVELSNGLWKIGWNAFRNCTSLTSIDLPHSLKEIDIGAFSGCTGLTKIHFPSFVRKISWDAFAGCTGLDGISVGSSPAPDFYSRGDCLIESKTGKIVLGCKSSVIDESACVRIISSHAFEGCVGLKSIAIPANIENVEAGAFAGCDNLERIDVASDSKYYHGSGNCLIKTDEKLLVAGCNNSVIPTDGSVESIAAYAFDTCEDMKIVKIPASVREISESAFRGCRNIERIEVEEGNNLYHSDGNCLIRTKEKLLVLGCKNSVIPTDGSVTSIGENAFRYCAELKEIVIPDTVESIGNYAFYSNKSIIRIKFGEGLTEIGEFAFNGCTNLLSVELPQNLTTMEVAAFGCCTSLKKIRVPAAMNNLGYAPFDGCSALELLVFEDPQGWFVTRDQGDWQRRVKGEPIELEDSIKNAEIMKESNFNKYVYKKRKKNKEA